MADPDRARRDAALDDLRALHRLRPDDPDAKWRFALALFNAIRDDTDRDDWVRRDALLKELHILLVRQPAEPRLQQLYRDLLQDVELLDRVLLRDFSQRATQTPTPHRTSGAAEDDLMVLADVRPGSSSPPSAAGPWLYTTWFATNRQPVDAADLSRGFLGRRDQAGRVHHGCCRVHVPRTHRFGSAGTAWWKRWARLEFTDDHLTLREIGAFASLDEFSRALAQAIGALDDADRAILAYIHGYNVSFEGAAVRAAQIGFDLKVPGVTAFFSWPSAAETEQYAADGASIEASEKDIADFLIDLARRSGATRVHILAHSMGNRGLLRAIQRIIADAEHRAGLRFGQIILAAPDVDADLFRDLAKHYPDVSERTTLYVSAKDRALAISRFLHGAPRAGYTPPVTILERIDTVEATQIDLTILGHSYYADAEAVLYDMKELLDDNKPPERRARVRARQTERKEPYWVIAR